MPVRYMFMNGWILIAFYEPVLLGTVKSKIMLSCNKKEVCVLDYLDVRN